MSAMTDEQTPAAGAVYVTPEMLSAAISTYNDAMDRRYGQRASMDGAIREALKLDNMRWPGNHPLSDEALGIVRNDADEIVFIDRPHVASPASSSSVVLGDASGVERDVQGLVRPDAMAGRRWRHKARGTTYTSLGFGKAQCSPSGLLDDENVVIYQGDDGSLWARRHAEFSDGRFEEITALRLQPSGETRRISVDDLAQEIRRVDGNHSLGAGALAEALMPFLIRPAPIALTPPAEPVSRPAGEGEREAVARQIQALLAIKNPSHPVPGLARELLQRAAALLSPAAPDAGGGWMPAADRPRSTGALWLALDAKGKLYPGVFVNHRIPESATLVQEYRPTMDREVLHSWAKDVVAAISTPAKASGEPVAWQRLHPTHGWRDMDAEDVDHYRAQGQQIRGLYAHPPAQGLALTANDIAGIIEQNADADADGLHNASQLAERIYRALSQPGPASEGAALSAPQAAPGEGERS